MMFSQFFNMAGGYTMNMPFSPGVLALIIGWSLLWKGLALWKSARNEQKIWFVILLVVNTLGILEILYLLLSKKECACCGHGHEEERIS